MCDRQQTSVGSDNATEPASKSLILENGCDNVHAIEVGAGFVWLGCCHRPSLLLRITPDFKECTPIQFGEQEYWIHDLAFDGKFLWVAHASGHISRIDPQTCELSSRKITVTSGQFPFLYTMIFDGHHLWAGTYTDPGCILRIDRESGSWKEFQIEAAPVYSLRTLASVNDTLWAGLYTVPGKVMIFDKASEKQRVIDLGEDNMLCTSSTFDGSHVWFGLDTMPAKLVRVNPQTLEFDTVCLSPKSSCVRGLVYDGRYLWAGLYTEPGELIRVDPRTGDYERHIMPAEFFNTRDLAMDGNWVLATTQNIRYQPSGLYGLYPAQEGREQ